jgi:hypothetical protein
MSDLLDERIRAVVADAVAHAPEAPSVDDVATPSYVAVESGAGGRRVFAVAAAALMLVAAVTVLTRWGSGTTAPTTGGDLRRAVLAPGSDRYTPAYVQEFGLPAYQRDASVRVLEGTRDGQPVRVQATASGLDPQMDPDTGYGDVRVEIAGRAAWSTSGTEPVRFTVVNPDLDGGVIQQITVAGLDDDAALALVNELDVDGRTYAPGDSGLTVAVDGETSVEWTSTVGYRIADDIIEGTGDGGTVGVWTLQFPADDAALLQSVDPWGTGEREQWNGEDVTVDGTAEFVLATFVRDGVAVRMSGSRALVRAAFDDVVVIDAEEWAAELAAAEAGWRLLPESARAEIDTERGAVAVVRREGAWPDGDPSQVICLETPASEVCRPTDSADGGEFIQLVVDGTWWVFGMYEGGATTVSLAFDGGDEQFVTATEVDRDKYIAVPIPNDVSEITIDANRITQGAFVITVARPPD